MESRHNNYIRNLIGFTMVNILWQIGSTLVHPETSLIYFLTQVNASSLAVSAVVPVFTFFSSVPCILWGAIIHINKDMRKILYLSCIWIIIPYFIVFMMMENSKEISSYFVPSLFLLLTCSNIGLSLESVAYQNYVSFVVPENKRGTLWGIVFSFGYIVSLAAYPIMNVLNKQLNIIQYYRAGFIFFFIFALIATHFFMLVKEPEIEMQETAEKVKWKDYFNSCISILKSNKNFRFFLVLEYFANFSVCITTFSFVYIISFFNIPNEDTIRLTVIYCIFFGIGNYIGGRIGDKKGFRFVMVLSITIQIIFTLVLLLGNNKLLMFPIYAFIILGIAMKEVAVINIPIDSTKNINKSQYIGLAKTLTAPSLLFSLLFGKFVDIGSLNARNVLEISVTVLIVAFFISIILFKEPRDYKE